MEFILWVWEHRNQPLTWATVISFIWFVLDKLGRKLINSQLKRLFRIRQKSEFSKYVENQARIEEKIDLLLEERGLKWGAVETTLSKNITQTAKNSSLFGWATAFPAVTARLRTMVRHLLSKNIEIKQYSLMGRKQTMTKDFLSGKKKMLAFIITVILNGLNDTLGLELSQHTLDSATYIGGGYVAIEGALDLIRSISNHFLTKAQINTTAQSQIAATVEQSYHGE